MKRTALIILGIGLFSFGALANKTITYLLAGSEVTSMCFDLSTPGEVRAIIHGHAPIQGGGGFGPVTTKQTVLTSGSIFNSVNTLATGTALTFWQTQEGL